MLLFVSTSNYKIIIIALITKTKQHKIYSSLLSMLEICSLIAADFILTRIIIRYDFAALLFFSFFPLTRKRFFHFRKKLLGHVDYFFEENVSISIIMLFYFIFLTNHHKDGKIIYFTKEKK